MQVEEGTEKLFCFTAHFQQKEFVGQKAINQENEEQISGDSCEEVLEGVWQKVKLMIKREILIDGDQITWAENESPQQDEMGKFVVFQDKVAKKTFLISQINSDALRKIRNKHVNVMVHIYGRSVSSKSVHQKVSASILQPADRDRAGANSTVSVIELVQQLKAVHGYFSAHLSSWAMWANAIQAGPIHKRESLVNELPPPHLVHLFRTIPTSETEVMRSVQNGLQIANNLNDAYAENLSALRDEFRKIKESTIRSFEVFEVRLEAAEEMLRANNRIVSTIDSALEVEENAVSLEEEQQISDLVDYDHII